MCGLFKRKFWSQILRFLSPHWSYPPYASVPSHSRRTVTIPVLQLSTSDLGGHIAISGFAHHRNHCSWTRQGLFCQVCSWKAISNTYLVVSFATSGSFLPPVKRSTVGRRAFPVAGPKTWNVLPEDITSSQSAYTFCRQLKTWLFNKSFPDIIIWYWLHLDF